MVHVRLCVDTVIGVITGLQAQPCLADYRKRKNAQLVAALNMFRGISPPGHLTASTLTGTRCISIVMACPGGGKLECMHLRLC